MANSSLSEAELVLQIFSQHKYFDFPKDEVNLIPIEQMKKKVLIDFMI